MCSEHSSHHLTNTIALAEHGSGSVSPNPMVGAIVVKNDTVIATGYHSAYGGLHAEAVALDRAGPAARGSTLYCNLEPCSYTAPQKHQPPCTRRIVAAGVKRVVIGQLDPNPRVRGDGVAQLRRAGIEVVIAQRSERFWRLNDAFNTWMALRHPLVHLVAALQPDHSIDTSGQTALLNAATPTRAYIDRAKTGRDAIAIGVEAVTTDTRSLVQALDDNATRTVVFDRRLQTPVDCELVSMLGDRLVIVGEEGFDQADRWRHLDAHGAAVCTTERSDDDAAWYGKAFAAVASKGITSLLIVAGEQLITALLKRTCFDRVSLFVDRTAIGVEGRAQLERALQIETVQPQRIGDRYLLDSYHRSWLPRVTASVGGGA